MELNDQTRILVVDMGAFAAGIMVDRISEVLRVPSNVIQAPPKFSVESEERLKGVAKLNNGRRMILILDPSKLIFADEINALNDFGEAHEQEFNENDITNQILDEEKLVTFKIDMEEYGVKIANVQEMNRMTDITKIAQAPCYIEGIVNLRGNVIPALDLRRLFKLEEKNSRCLEDYYS
ncbi:MAG: chemotaxis protein CheW [Anaerotignum sp.]|nr:chemotaxis protein CheW [Anaerotignum sp.]